MRYIAVLILNEVAKKCVYVEVVHYSPSHLDNYHEISRYDQ